MVYVLTIFDITTGTNIPLAVFNQEETAMYVKKNMDKTCANIEKASEVVGQLQINAQPNSVKIVKVEGLYELQKLQETIDAIRANGRAVYVVND